MRRVLVVGADPDRRLALEAARSADLVLLYSFAVACELEEGLGYRGETIDITFEIRQVESVAGAWARDFVTHLRTHASWLSRDLLTTVRRRLHIDVFWPLAVARARAELVRGHLDADCELSAEGVSALEVIALRNAAEEAGACVGRMSEASQSDSGDVSGGSDAKTVDAPYSAREAFDESRRLRRLHAGIAAARAAQPVGPALLALAAVPIHMRLFESSLRELNSRGWRCTVLQVYPYCDLSAEATSVGATSLDLAPLLPHHESPWQRTLRILMAESLRRAANFWTRSAGLRAYSDYVVTGLDTQLWNARRFMTTYAALLRDLRPQAVLSVSELYPGIEPIVEVSRRRGVPTVHVQHGNIPEIARFSDFRFDAFCVFGEAYKETLVRLDTQPERIRVTGSPFMGATQEQTQHAEDRSTPHGPDSGELDLFTILFIAGYLSDFTSHAMLYESLKMVLSLAQADEHIRVIIKLHPAANSGPSVVAYETAIAEHPGASVTVTDRGEVYDLVRACDCVATRGSTVAFESAWLRKPVILLNPLGAEPHLPLASEGTALQASDAAEFAESIRRLRSGFTIPEATYEAVEQRYAFGADGKAGVRIADVCEELAAGAPGGASTVSPK